MREEDGQGKRLYFQTQKPKKYLLSLATNHIQWAVGIHHGIPGIFVQPQSYLEAVPASFINCVGSRFALQYQNPWKADAHYGPGGFMC